MNASVRVLAFACATAAAWPAACPAADASPADEAGVQVIELPAGAHPGKTFTAYTLIPAPVSKLCSIVQDYAAYASYMPNTRSAQTVSSGEGYVIVDMTLDLPLGQEKRYRLRLEPEQTPNQCKLSWKLLPRADLKQSDTIADTTGYWLFKPAADSSSKTLVEYHVYADPGPVPFGFGWIVDLMSKRSLPRTLEALRSRAAQ